MSMNCWLYDGRLQVSPGYKVITKMNGISRSRSLQTWVMMDEREDSIDDGYFAVDMTGYPTPRARLTGPIIPPVTTEIPPDLSFADGHAEVQTLA